jgi:NAD+ kinase
LIEGRYIASERLVLDCEHDGKRHQAINEIELRALSRLVFIDVHVNDTEIRTIRGDGVVIGTPTGSTGFLLSTGAPIVMPDVRCLILDGINEHNLTSRALILTPESRIRLYISDETKASEVYLIIDGSQICNLEPGGEVHISQSERTAKLIYFEDNYFFHNLSSKLSW